MHDQRSLSGSGANNDSHASLAASASTSAPCLRHRSSTLKPLKKTPARLNVPQIPFTASSDGHSQRRPPSPLPRIKSIAPSAPVTNGHAVSLTPTPATPSHPTGIRAHFAQLLPRHAVFLVRISIHELNNVPLVRGEFGVRWKVKGVTNGGLLGKVKGRGKGKGKSQNTKGTSAPDTSSRSHDAHGSLKGKGKERESDMDNASLLDASTSISDTHSITASSSTHSHSHGHGSPISLARGWAGAHNQTHPRNIPTLVVSSNSPSTPAPVISRNISGTSVASTLSSASPSTHPNLHLPAHYLSTEWCPQLQAYSSTLSLASQGSPQSHAPSLADTPPTDGYTPAKGQTPFIVLKDHNVIWEQTLNFVVQMGVARETGELGECPVKLMVMQRVIHGDPDAPRNPRVGSIYLNLAQYVSAGIVTRRYLLRQSKTNATLKLTVQLEHTSGAPSYIAPPLPKGEILSGVAGLLESDTYRNYPSALGLYSSGSGSSDSLSDASSDSSPSAPCPPQGPGPAGQTKAHSRQRRTKNHKRNGFDPSKLPDIRGPRATEKLIEAIFNPAPVTSPTRVTPFTFLLEGYDEQDGAYEGEDQGSLEPEHDMDGKFVFGIAEDICGVTSLEEREDMEELDQDMEQLDSESDYHSARSGRSVLLHTEDGEYALRSKRSLRSIGSRLGLRVDGKNGDAVNIEVTASIASVDVGATPTAEKRMWWQKVLRPV